MDNNFYLGSLYHSKKMFKPSFCEKLILYSDDNINFLDVKNNMYYTCDTNSRDYIIRESITPCDISLYKDDYLYMLSKCKEGRMVRKKLFNR